MGIERVCTTHHVTILTEEDDLAHMGPDCVIYTTGSGLGSIEPVTNAPAIMSNEIGFEAGTILPYDTKEEKEKRRKQLGYPEQPKSK
jgi:hypothetical protein